MTAEESKYEKTLLPSLLIGATIGIALLVGTLFLHENSVTDAGLGDHTTVGIEPHSTLGEFEFDTPAVAKLDRIMTARGMTKRALWFGASQLYGINQRSPRDRTVGFRIFSALSKENVDLGVIGLPNATPREHLVLLASLAPRIKPDLLVVGAVYDDMRHPEIRRTINELAQQPLTRKSLTLSTSGNDILAKHGPTVEKHRPGGHIIRRDASWTQRSEAWLTAALEHSFGFTTARKEGRGRVLLALHDARRFFELQRFRWTRDLSTYRVPILPGPYQDNLAAWSAMLDLASQRRIAVLIYIAPRPADFFPYDNLSYAKYKRDLRHLADKFGARLISIEDVVPPQYWGKVDITFGFPVRDPFHFKNKGHELMAKALLPEIQRALQGAP